MTQIYSFTVIGTNFADVLTTEIATALEPTLVRGLGGDDTIIGYGPLDRLEGGLGSDNISSRGGIVVGGLGSDTITVMADAAVAVYDGAGNDIVSITGNGTSAVRIYADNSDPSGNDFFRVQNAPGAVISYQAATQSITLFMNAQASGADIGTDQVFGFGAAIGGSGNDVMHAAISGSTLFGGEGNDQLFGFDGMDVLVGGGGGDRISGGEGADRLDGGLGDDIITAAGGTVTGGAGNDVITAQITAGIVVSDGAGSDEIFLRPQASQQIRVFADVSDGSGNDTFVVDGGPGAVISFHASTQGIQLQLEKGAFGAEVGSDRIVGFTIAIGGSGNDLMSTSETGGELRGGAGDDELQGFAGNDTLIGGDGNDRIIDIEGGKINVFAGNGDDTVEVSGSGGRIFLGDGTNLLTFNSKFVDPTGEFIVTLWGIDNSIVCTDANEVLRIVGEGIAAIDLGENGTIMAQYEFGTYNGSLSSTNETLILKNYSDFSINLNSSQYSGIDRVFTSYGKQFLRGSTTAYNAFESGSGNDVIFTYADVTDVNAGSGDDEIYCSGQLTNVTAGAGDDLVMCTTGKSLIDLGIGLNRVFARGGAVTVNFDTDTSDTSGQALDYVFNFTQGTDKIQLESGADIESFIATGYDTMISSMSGVRFDTVSGDMLFIMDVTLAQLSTSDFLV